MTAKRNAALTKAEALSESWKKRDDYKGYVKTKGSSFNSWKAILYTQKGNAIGFPVEWRSYKQFMKDVQGDWSLGKIVCRFNTKLPHGPNNSYWAAKGTEHIGRLIKFEYDGQIKTLMEWAQELDLSYQGVRQRYFRGKNLSPEEILFGKKRVIKSPFDTKKAHRLHRMLGAYRLRDKKRNLECDIDLQWLREFTAEGCHYCGDINRVGLDRIDNFIGHIKTNVVACCYSCNCARNNNFSYEEMLILGEAIRKIKSCR